MPFIGSKALSSGNGRHRPQAVKTEEVIKDACTMIRRVVVQRWPAAPTAPKRTVSSGATECVFLPQPRTSQVVLGYRNSDLGCGGGAAGLDSLPRGFARLLYGAQLMDFHKFDDQPGKNNRRCILRMFNLTVGVF